MNYDSYFDPPAEKWGACPECGASQEDAEYDRESDTYTCPCGHEYAEEDAHADPRDDEPADFDERREERGL